jgi:hypothetical protein
MKPLKSSYATNWSLIALYQTLDETERSRAASKQTRDAHERYDCFDFLAECPGAAH